MKNSNKIYQQKKPQFLEESCSSCFSKVLPHLVNTNVDKYYPVGMYGLRSLLMGAIHPDLAILETHFGGRVPLNLEKASKEFQNILKEKRFGIKMDLKKDLLRVHTSSLAKGFRPLCSP